MASYNEAIKKEFNIKLEDNPYGKSMEESVKSKGGSLTKEETETIGRLNSQMM